MTHWHNNRHEPFQGNEPCANCQFISQQPTSDYAIAQIWAQSNVSIKERRIDEPPHFRFCMYTRELRDLGTMPLSAIPESMQPASLHRSQPDRGSSAQVIEGEHQSQPVRDSSARSSASGSASGMDPAKNLAKTEAKVIDDSAKSSASGSASGIDHAKNAAKTATKVIDDSAKSSASGSTSGMDHAKNPAKTAKNPAKIAENPAKNAAKNPSKTAAENPSKNPSKTSAKIAEPANTPAKTSGKAGLLQSNVPIIQPWRLPPDPDEQGKRPNQGYTQQLVLVTPEQAGITQAAQRAKVLERARARAALNAAEAQAAAEPTSAAKTTGKTMVRDTAVPQPPKQDEEPDDHSPDSEGPDAMTGFLPGLTGKTHGKTGVVVEAAAPKPPKQDEEPLESDGDYGSEEETTILAENLRRRYLQHLEQVSAGKMQRHLQEQGEEASATASASGAMEPTRAAHEPAHDAAAAASTENAKSKERKRHNDDSPAAKRKKS